MSTEFDTIKGIAKQSLMPDFFGARVDEEGLWSTLRQVLSGIQTATPNATLATMKRVAGEATTATEFIEKIKASNLWLPLKDLVLRVQVK